MSTSLRDILLQPIPDYTAARKLKSGYRTHPLTTEGPLSREPLIDIAEYGIAGQSYYSRPNSAYGNKPVPGVADAVYVRRTIAERLAAINFHLQSTATITELFGKPVELYIDEGYRAPDLQERLYNELFPALIRQQYPDWDETQVLKRRDELSAKPPKPGRTPSPHATGAAVDIKLRYKQPELGFMADANINMGHGGADMSGLTDPDYFEHNDPKSAGQRKASQNRRVFYWVMRGALNGNDSGFVVNPTEYWHWSYGDQLWGRITQAPTAFYGQAKIP